MIDFERAKKAKGIRATFVRGPKVDAKFVKNLRKKLNMPQSMFARLLNVSNKTVEKWEQGVNPVSTGNAIAMILFDSHPELVSEFIMLHDETDIENTPKRPIIFYKITPDDSLGFTAYDKCMTIATQKTLTSFHNYKKAQLDLA